jgi:hypothetical protein
MNTEQVEAPDPGIYHDVPFEQYLAWPYVNNSSLGYAARFDGALSICTPHATYQSNAVWFAGALRQTGAGRVRVDEAPALPSAAAALVPPPPPPPPPVSCRIPFVEVSPRSWMKAMGIRTRRKTETPTQWKNHLKQLAQQLFPHEQITLATADALLIAEYCRRVWHQHQPRQEVV